MPRKKEDKQTTFLWWDGKQVKIDDFITEPGLDDPDDKDSSYEAVYKNMRVNTP